MTSSLVGSEMCIRDREWGAFLDAVGGATRAWSCVEAVVKKSVGKNVKDKACLLYTSDAADDM
eukprot:751271-Prorocentrum_lima.AAC.1